MRNKQAKYWVFIAVALIFVLVIGAGALFAESDESSVDENRLLPPIREKIAGLFGSGERTFEDLTDEEKDELYNAMEDVKIEKDALLDKQVELGLVDATLAEEMKERAQERFDEARENGEPLFGKMPGRMPGRRPGMPGMSRLPRENFDGR